MQVVNHVVQADVSVASLDGSDVGDDDVDEEEDTKKGLNFVVDTVVSRFFQSEDLALRHKS